MRAWPILLAGMLVSTATVAAPPKLQDLLKPEQYTMVNISPGGDYVAVGTRIDDRVYAAIVDRKTKQIVRGLDPDERGAVERLEWVSGDRLFLMNSRVGTVVEQAYLEPAILAINVDGTRKNAFSAAVVDTIRNDDEHILISVCGRGNSKGCWSHVRKVDTKGGYTGPRVAEAPMWNADFMADNDGNVRFAYGWDHEDIQQLWLLRGDQWTLVNDESTSGVEVHPIGFSRDGSSAYLQSEQRSGPDVIERLTVATAGRKVVLSDPRLDPSFIVWSADRAQPIGAAYGRGVPRARFWDDSDPDAKLLRQLEAAFPEDAVAFTSGSRDGQHVIVSVWSDRDPGSYYLLDRAAKSTNLIFRNKPWLDPTALPRTEAIEFAARDGTPITGYVTMPAGGNGAPPLVVLPHGGPFDIQDLWSYDEEVQILASHGYAVLRVNFRGSGGFGRSFVEAGHRQWGRKMQDDVTDATRWLVKQGRVDGTRICLFGSSYGGYAALMGMADQPDLYRCAIATAAVSDLNLMWKWGDIKQSRWGRAYLVRAIGEDAKERLAYSPVSRAADIRGDLMLVHGTRDSRVPYEHAKAMRDALDKAGKTYEGYFPKDETHGIYGEENREEYYTRVLRFLDDRLGAGRAVTPAGAGAH